MICFTQAQEIGIGFGIGIITILMYILGRTMKSTETKRSVEE